MRFLEFLGLSLAKVAILRFREGLPKKLLILSAKFKSFLILTCNRFPAELNHWFRRSQAAAFPKILPGSPRRSTSETVEKPFSIVNGWFSGVS